MTIIGLDQLFAFAIKKGCGWVGCEGKRFRVHERVNNDSFLLGLLSLLTIRLPCFA